MKQLTMTFLNEHDKMETLKPNVTSQDLTGDEVKSAMEAICTLNILEKKDINMCSSIHSAHYSETIITPLV